MKYSFLFIIVSLNNLFVFLFGYWAIARCDSIAIAYRIKTGIEKVICTQKIVDFAIPAGSYCDGNLIENAVNYILRNGITEEQFYPCVTFIEPNLVPLSNVIN